MKTHLGQLENTFLHGQTNFQPGPGFLASSGRFSQSYLRNAFTKAEKQVSAGESIFISIALGRNFDSVLVKMICRGFEPGAFFRFCFPSRAHCQLPETSAEIRDILVNWWSCRLGAARSPGGIRNVSFYNAPENAAKMRWRCKSLRRHWPACPPSWKRVCKFD